jgi:nicotinate dehydrogenase subunit B
MSANRISRRDFLVGGGILFVGIATGGSQAVRSQTAASSSPLDARELDTWIAIGRDGSVTGFTGRVDLGTGLETAFAQIVAEELYVPFQSVHIVMGDTERTADQGRTTASQGIVTGAQPLQVAAARARVALIELAARRWNVDPATLATAGGTVFVASHPAKRIGYGQLIGNKRFDIELEVESVGQWGPVLKDAVPPRNPAQYEVVGKSIPRVDIPAKVFGTFEYVHNLRLPQMLHARVLRPPRARVRLAKVDRSTLPAGLNVRIVQERDFVAVVGEHEANVVKAASALQVTWESGSPLPSASELPQALRTAPVIGEETRHARGNVADAFDSASQRIEADFEFPCQLHGMLGPSCAVADVRAGSATVWSGTQSPLSDRDDIADMLGLPRNKVRLIWVEAAGSYGRLATDDAAADAALLSKLTGRPVRVQWSRQNEHGSSPSCPPVSIRARASIDAAGKLAGIDYTQWSPSFATGEKGNQLAWRALGTAPGTKRLSGWASDISHYDIPALRIRNIYVQPWLRHVYLRSPGGFQSTLAYESLIDEAAYLTGSDPVAYRLRHLSDARDRAVLARVAELAGWEPRRAYRGAAGPVVQGQGVAFARSGTRATRIAMVLNVEANLASGEVRLRRLAIVVDCGLVVNPDGARNQIEGAALQGLSRALKEEVKVDGSSLTSLDWGTYPILRFSEVPEMTVELIARPELPPSAIGEQGTSPAAAVLANAIFDATGRRLRRVPFTPERVLAASVTA